MIRFHSINFTALFLYRKKRDALSPNKCAEIEDVDVDHPRAAAALGDLRKHRRRYGGDFCFHIEQAHLMSSAVSCCERKPSHTIHFYKTYIIIYKRIHSFRIRHIFHFYSFMYLRVPNFRLPERVRSTHTLWVALLIPTLRCQTNTYANLFDTTDWMNEHIQL